MVLVSMSIMAASIKMEIGIISTTAKLSKVQSVCGYHKRTQRAMDEHWYRRGIPKNHELLLGATLENWDRHYNTQYKTTRSLCL